MKKIISLLLCVLLVLSMTACGAGSETAATTAPKADAPAAPADAGSDDVVTTIMETAIPEGMAV